jgi:hypothetical protein
VADVGSGVGVVCPSTGGKRFDNAPMRQRPATFYWFVIARRWLGVGCYRLISGA